MGTYYSINRDAPGSYGRCHLWPEKEPVFVPSSASASHGPSGLQISLDFVPPSAQLRELVDGRGSRLLLLKEKDDTQRLNPSCQCCLSQTDYFTPDLIVCEPLTRQYKAIPQADDGRVCATLKGRVCILDALLLDGDDAGEAIAMTNFRVVLVLYDYDEDFPMSGHNGHGYPSVLVFTCGGDGGWKHGGIDTDDVYLPWLEQVQRAGRTGGRIYWGCDGDDRDKQVMVLDEHTLQLSTMALSDHMMNWAQFGRDNLRVVSAGDDTVRIVHLTYDGDLEVFGQRHGTDAWVPEISLQLVTASRGLPGGHKQYLNDAGTKIIDVEEGLVVVSSPVNDRWCLEPWMFSVDLETLELKREHGRNHYTGPAFPYTLPWPPGYACLCR